MTAPCTARNERQRKGKQKKMTQDKEVPFIAIQVLLESTQWGAAYGQVCECYPDLALMVVKYRQRVESHMLERIRASLQARAQGCNVGGDIEVMNIVDAIVKKEAATIKP